MLTNRHIKCLRILVITCFVFMSLLTVWHAHADEATPAYPTYTIGKIPPQSVWYGKTLKFYVSASTPTPQVKYSLVLSSSQHGQLSLDKQTGLFIYQPDLADKFTFLVTFSVNNPKVHPQTITIAPMQHLPSENEIINCQRPVPPADSNDYLVVSKLLSKEPEEFNNESRTTRKIEISGKTVVIDANSDTNHLYQRLNTPLGSRVNANIRELNIYAEIVIIRSPLRLRQTQVTIYARELRFEDSASGPKACIITTPLDYTKGANAATVATAAGSDGGPGANGGNVFLHIAKLTTNADGATRLITSGGTGQDAGPGKTGDDGTSMAAFTSAITASGHYVDDLPPSTVFAAETWPNQFPFNITFKGIPNPKPFKGVQDWPGDGKPAKPAGRPGTGGVGGNIYTTVALNQGQIDTSFGSPGSKGADILGGKAGEPRHAIWWNYYQWGDTTKRNIIEQHDSIPGANASAPDALPHPANGGTLQLLPAKDDYIWLHPYALKAIISHAKDAYLNGNLDYVKTELSPYSDILNSGISKPAEYETEFDQCRSEILVILHRIDSNLDYFGNPAGWVPLLSLEATMHNFDNEVNASVPLLYLSYWIEKRAEEDNKDKQALQDSISKLDTDISTAADAYNDAQKRIPFLETSARNINEQVKIIQTRITERENFLLGKTRAIVDERHEVPVWKKALGVLSLACKVVPVYQPVLGSIGAGLDIITSFNPSQPLTSVGKIGDVASQFNEANFEKSRKDLDAMVVKVNRRNTTSYKEYAKNLLDVGKEWAPAFQAFAKAAQGTQIPQDEISAELANIKAQDPEFNDLVSQVSDLLGQKQAFLSALAQFIQTAHTSSERMSSDFLAMGAMNDNLDDKTVQFDQGTLVYVRDMKKCVQERLLKYQYYMAKAYEYRFLEQYPDPLDTNKITDKLVGMLGSGYTLNPNDFQAIVYPYKRTLREIVDKGIDRFNQRTPEKSNIISFGLTKNELVALNKNDTVTIDLGQELKVPLDQENRRIHDLDIEKDEHGKYTIKVEPSKVKLSTARMYLTLTHEGQSEVRSNYKDYLFHAGAKGVGTPFVWGGSYDLVAHRFRSEGLSDGGRSLLANILFPDKSDLPKLETYKTWFIEPPATSLLTIKKDRNPNVRMDISYLRLSVVVDFYRNPSKQNILNIETEGGYKPYIICTTDGNGRSDGRGNFHRIYSDQKVKVSADPYYGNMVFSYWADEKNKIMSNNYEVNLSNSRTIRAVYVRRSGR